MTHVFPRTRRVSMRSIAFAGAVALLLAGCGSSPKPRPEPKSQGVDLVKEGIVAGRDVKVVVIDGHELLSIPRVHFTEHSLDVEQEFYQYRDGRLVRVPVASQ
jgi:hypothetical protein